MKLTPMEIVQQHFKRVWRGYDPKEVDAFLEFVKSEMESLLTENGALKDEIKRLEARLEEFKEREKSLNNAIMLAQKIKEDIEKNARKEAEIIISEAKMKAQEIVNSAQLRAMELMGEIKELKRQKIIFERHLRNLIETHLKLLESEEKEEIEEKIEPFIKSLGMGKEDKKSSKT
jgi:cell division initiation protein